jgi:N-acetylmuramoyl-L-alanine amidase
MRSCGKAVAVAIIAIAIGGVLSAQTASPAAAYRRLLQREAALRMELDGASASAAGAILKRMRAITAAYEQLSKTHRTSGYSDNALWQGAVLSGDAFTRFGYSADRANARRLLGDLAARFPSSSLVAGIGPYRDQLNRAAASPPRPVPATATTRTTTTMSTKAASVRAVATTLAEVRREVLPDAVRLTLVLDRETAFTSERLDNAARLHIDLRSTRIAQTLTNARFAFPDDIVRQVRVTQTEGAHARVALELERTARFSVYPMYDPYRLIVDIERTTSLRPTSTPATVAATGMVGTRASPPKPLPPVGGRGGYSLSRQLGLGAARIVIDPGHGGHDPGAESAGLDEAGLVLDVALRLERLLLDTPGVEVMLTRRTSEYVSLDERTAIANRSGADLFLSIHANASSNTAARGVETYFLNFAPNAEAEAIAARENAASSKTMRNLNDIVKAIALNDKVDESRDFAMRVQTSLYGQLRKVNNQARSLGVKQAPFQVLIGATMPSVLAEISFITNEREAALLKTEKYRQQIAAALLDGIMGYQRSLKTVRADVEKAAR